MKARGRPRLAANDPSVNVHFRLPAKQYDLTQKRADQARLALADWLRLVVDRACRKPDKGQP
jgi:hypothetical protein